MHATNETTLPHPQILEGKVALVTGSSRGIGAAIARRFARHGASVAVHGRDAQALAAVHGEIERDGGRAIRVAADVTSYAEIETMRLGIERELGPIDILVANAGGSPLPPGLDLALQAGPFGIRVNGIAPETILTERNMDLIPDSLRQSLVEQHPIRRLGTPEDVAATALFLVSEDSGWITGVILDVAGGAQ